MTQPRTLPWFVRHEFRLAWRDWLARITAGGRRRLVTIVIALILFIIFMHGLASIMIGGIAEVGLDTDKVSYVVITGTLLGVWSLMLAHAIETATHAFYTRSDHDLILSSPVKAHKVFAVRVVTFAPNLGRLGDFPMIGQQGLDQLAGGVEVVAATQVRRGTGGV